MDTIFGGKCGKTRIIYVQEGIIKRLVNLGLSQFKPGKSITLAGKNK